jgi:hypothetical protein
MLHANVHLPEPKIHTNGACLVLNNHEEKCDYIKEPKRRVPCLEATKGNMDELNVPCEVPCNFMFDLEINQANLSTSHNP